VRVDARVELMTTAARLAGFDEFGMANSKSPYADEVEKHFGRSASTRRSRGCESCAQSKGVSYDAVPSFAVHIDGVKEPKELVPFDLPPERLDPRWGGAAARPFLAELRDFAAVSHAAEFFEAHRPFYAEVERRLSERLLQSNALPWFDRFFGVRAGAKYTAVPGLLCGGGNFGVGVRFPDAGRKRSRRSSVAGSGTRRASPCSRELPAALHPRARAQLHQPFVDRFETQLAEPGAKLYATCAARMRSQSYGTWKTMVYESLVRASVIRCRLATEGKDAAQTQAREEVGKSFAWVPELAMLFGEYESAREQYPTFDLFMPRVVEFFERYASKAAEMAPRRPRWSRSSPPMERRTSTRR
jgi:hypothetical protein